MTEPVASRTVLVSQVAAGALVHDAEIIYWSVSRGHEADAAEGISRIAKR